MNFSILKVLCIVTDNDDLLESFNYTQLGRRYDYVYIYCESPRRSQSILGNETSENVKFGYNDLTSLDRIILWSKSSNVDVCILGSREFKREVSDKYTYRRDHIKQISLF